MIVVRIIVGKLFKNLQKKIRGLLRSEMQKIWRFVGRRIALWTWFMVNLSHALIVMMLRSQSDFLNNFIFLKKTEYTLCDSNFQFIDQDGKVGKIRQLPETNGEIQNSFLIKNPIAQSAVMIRASMLGALRYDENFEVAEDLEFWMRLGTLYKMYNLQKILVQYRIHGKNSVLIKQKQMIKNTLLARKKPKNLAIRWIWR